MNKNFHIILEATQTLNTTIDYLVTCNNKDLQPSSIHSELFNRK